LLKLKPLQRNDDADADDLLPNDHARLVLFPCGGCGCGCGDGDGDGDCCKDAEAVVGNCVKVTSGDTTAAEEERGRAAERSESESVSEWRTCALRSLPPPLPGPETARGAILARSCPPLLLRLIDDADDDPDRSVFMIVSVLCTSIGCRNE
jgi:hypothetical protein